MASAGKCLTLRRDRCPPGAADASGFRTRHLPPEPQGGPLAVIGEVDLDVVEAGGGAVLDGHDDLLVAAEQVKIGIAPACSSEEPRRAWPGRVPPLLREWWTSRTARYAHLARDSVHEAAERIADSIAADIL